MASIIKRGKTYSIVYYEGEGKSRHQVWESGLSYNTAKSRKAQLEFDVARNVLIDRNDVTVSEFLYEFVEKYGEKKWVASTYDGNVGLLENYVYPYLGDAKLRSIRTKTVDDYYHFLLFSAEPAANMGHPKRDKITPSLIYDIHKVLRCAFNQAVRWEYIAKNPFLNATLPEHKEKKRDALTPEQIHKVLEFTDRPDIYDYYMMHCAIQLAFACSMRGGEVGGAQWSRYDAENQMLYVDRVIDRVDKELMDRLTKMDVLYKFPNLFPGTRTVIVLKQPKTEGSIRNVYTPETVTQKLTTLRKMQERLKLELGKDGYMDYDLIICQANGRPIMTEHLNKRFKDILVAMGDPEIDTKDIVFHSIRHTSAGVKLRLSKGDLKAVQGDGGWNTPDMVTKRYAHIMDEDRRNLAAEMEARFYQGGGSINEPPEEEAADEDEEEPEIVFDMPGVGSVTVGDDAEHEKIPSVTDTKVTIAAPAIRPAPVPKTPRVPRRVQPSTIASEAPAESTAIAHTDTETPVEPPTEPSAAIQPAAVPTDAAAQAASAVQAALASLLGGDPDLLIQVLQAVQKNKKA